MFSPVLLLCLYWATVKISRSPLTIAHRGASGYAPENTLLSLSKALDMGAQWVEIDVQWAHEEAYLLHDRTLLRVAHLDKSLAELSPAEISNIELVGEARIPTLDQAVSLLQGKCALNIELKGSPPVGHVAQKIQGLLDAGWNKEALLVSSFNHPLLVELRALLPDAPLAPILYGHPFDELSTVHSLRAATVCIDINLATEHRIAKFHEKHVRVFVYTANEPRDIHEMIDCGADGIISNYPDRVNACKANHEKPKSIP